LLYRPTNIKMPTILLIDTAAAVATIGLAEDGKILAIRHHERAMEQAAVVNTLIEEVVTAADRSLDHIDAVAVCAGPGSYTGLRVGLSMAKGLCFALDKPLMLFDRLSLIALDFVATEDIAVILKARQGEYFAAFFNNKLEALAIPKHYYEDELLQYLANFSGSIVTDNSPDDLFGTGINLDTNYRVEAEKWASWATARYTQGTFDDIAYSEPFYLKPAYTTQSKK
jgi:tRNA threonylcarbamoyladenosine biosynthesis protein TsaB